MVKDTTEDCAVSALQDTGLASRPSINHVPPPETLLGIVRGGLSSRMGEQHGMEHSFQVSSYQDTFLLETIDEALRLLSEPLTLLDHDEDAGRAHSRSTCSSQ
eukprot:CAMPEP_0176126236 /NCGR_PEP_ID=MMETSP0120_2-20121206/63708_1 /TAXON_ID=160619 /ORGANISM="Kryptoperidinium foliaceum, Strain CCMP 1326" /LENGTH=102 /DNA_ID=CAMNT_0017461149 /DNA_START=85 /DNA_END=393 /DNA_ORIENTATION=-